jgi:hypothetical protein
VLEEVLRSDTASAQTLAEVGRRIRQRIGFGHAVAGERPFLEAFYAAQRDQLERGRLLGVRKANKAADAAPPKR